MFEVELIINGLFSAVLTGVGVTVGTWFSNRVFLARMEKILNKLEVKQKRKK